MRKQKVKIEFEIVLTDLTAGNKATMTSAELEAFAGKIADKVTAIGKELKPGSSLIKPGSEAVIPLITLKVES